MSVCVFLLVTRYRTLGNILYFHRMKYKPKKVFCFLLILSNLCD